MRRLFFVTSIAGLCGLALVPACQKKDDPTPPAAPPAATTPVAEAPVAPPPSAPPAPPPPVSLVRAGDEAVAGQLLTGFFEAQEGAWRWTAPSFSVKLGLPPGAAEKGAILRLKLNLPKPRVSQNPTTTVKVAVNGSNASKTFSKGGDHELELELAPAALTGDSIVAEFTVDKPFMPGGADTRTLGVIATSIELVAK